MPLKENLFEIVLYRNLIETFPKTWVYRMNNKTSTKRIPHAILTLYTWSHIQNYRCKG